MMDVREKLIEICFREFCDLAGDSPCGCDGCPYGKYSSENGECYEEYKNDKFVKMEKTGVTVQEWIPVTDRLPEDEGWYLVYTTPNREYKSINKAMFCKVGAGDNFETYWRGAGGHWENITHWMPMPNPPKGE